MANVPAYLQNLSGALAVVVLVGVNSVGRCAESKATTPSDANAQAVADRAGWGTVRGQIVVDGQYPQEYLVRRGNPIYAPQALLENIQRVSPRQIGTEPNDVLNRAVRIDPQSHGLRDVFVYLRQGPSTIHPWFARRPRHRIEVRRSTKWEFEPRTLIANPGQRVRVTKLFEGPSIVHAHAVINSSINVSLSGNESVVDVEFKSAEKMPFLVTDDVNPSAIGYWLIAGHPYAVITDVDGTFEIRDLPAGRHELTIWHERSGYLARKQAVIVRPGQTTTLKPLHVSPMRLEPSRR